MRVSIIILTVLALSSCTQGQMIQREVKVDARGQHLTEIPDSVYKKPEITYLDWGSKNVSLWLDIKHSS